MSKLPSTVKRELKCGLIGTFVERKMEDKFFVVQRVWMKLSGSRQVTTLRHHAFTVSMSHSGTKKIAISNQSRTKGLTLRILHVKCISVFQPT
jgi:hypothetical protein